MATPCAATGCYPASSVGAMNVQHLVDAIVRQTTVLIAQLATTGGIRAPVAHLADRIFLDLARELDAQGVSRKVSADMFGMALRAYLRKIQRLSESSTEQGRTLWEAIYEFIRARDVVTRAQVLSQFHRDEEDIVRGVLHDLCESGLVFQAGSGPHAALRTASDDELDKMGRLWEAGVDELVWAFVYRYGPLTSDEILRMEAFPAPALEGAVQRLLSDGRLTEDDGKVLRTNRLLVPLGAEIGWEAAVFDHYHALVTTICRKLSGTRRSAPDDCVGGSTYTFQVWPGHPMEGEVRGALARFRAEHSALRGRVRAVNDALESVPASAYEVVVYGGQHVLVDEEEAST
jgi:hypothetical protein